MASYPASPSPPGESRRIREEIERFLSEDRLQPKLDKLKAGDDEARQRLIDEHRPAAWLADAVRRVGQIQLVSHAVKFTHPSADGSSLASRGNPAAPPLELGTHTLGDDWAPDVVGNAAALDVYKFLRLKVDGRTLLERAEAGDPALAAALSDDPAQAGEWLSAFAGLGRSRGRPASHKLARQIYWPVGEGQYHLLAPLFSSSLAHAAYRRINDDLFSDGAKAAREARRAGKHSERGFRDYPRLAIQSFGGSKPQNISQLNSERRGENYLLPSLPPVWKSAEVKPPLGCDTVFMARRQFGARPEVRRLAEVLRDFLVSVRNATSNVRIRATREQLVADLVDQVLQMAAELRTLEPGWSVGEGCRLNLDEQCWLDPLHHRYDEASQAHYLGGAWKDEVCRRFAAWLNGRLQTDKTGFGDDEALEWRRVLDRELNLLKEDLGDE